MRGMLGKNPLISVGYRYFGVLFLMAVLLSSGCSKKKKETTPKNAPAQKKDSKQPEGSSPQAQETSVESEGNTAPKEDMTSSEQKKSGQHEETNASSVQKKGKSPAKKQQTEMDRARAALRQGKYEEVERITRALLEREYKNYDAMLLLAEAYISWGRPGMARKVLDHIAIIKKKNKEKLSGRWYYLNGRYLLYMARRNEVQGLVVEAITWRSNAIKAFSNPLCRDLPEALFYLGMLQIENREFAKGEKSLSRALALAKAKGLPLAEDPRIHFNLGVAKYQLKQWKAAHDEWLIALNLKKRKCPECHYNLALLCSLDVVTPQALGMGADLKRKAACLKEHATAYLRYLDRTRSRDNKARQIVKSWLSKARSMSNGGKK